MLSSRSEGVENHQRQSSSTETNGSFGAIALAHTMQGRYSRTPRLPDASLSLNLMSSLRLHRLLKQARPYHMLAVCSLVLWSQVQSDSWPGPSGLCVNLRCRLSWHLRLCSSHALLPLAHTQDRLNTKMLAVFIGHIFKLSSVIT